MLYNPNNLLLNVDSYKMSHFLQYPPGARFVSSYIEARGGAYDRMVFFGLQMFLKQYLSKPITMSDIDEAERFCKLHFVPFNRDGWMHILNRHGGWLPIRIQAIAEGTVLPIRHVVVQIVNTDPAVPWLTSYLETAILRAVWYPTTVATQSWEIKQDIMASLGRTADDPVMSIPYKLNDFGARGVSSFESSGIGGAAHLVNFAGTDNIPGVIYSANFYNETMAGHSIPAAEHSTITSWGGPNFEVKAFANMLEKFGGKGPLLAVVSDSYDIYRACRDLWGGTLKAEVIELGAKKSTLVVRPDSGDARTVPIEVLEILMERFGEDKNSKGFRMLPPYLRVIQGDGVNQGSIRDILANCEAKQISTDNLAFGMGGALLQQLNRDTMEFAMKANAIMIDEKWQPVFKDPVGDSAKKSKKGRLALVVDSSGQYRTVPEQDALLSGNNLLRDVYLNGRLLVNDSFEQVRARSNEPVGADLKRAA